MGGTPQRATQAPGVAVWHSAGGADRDLESRLVLALGDNTGRPIVDQVSARGCLLPSIGACYGCSSRWHISRCPSRWKPARSTRTSRRAWPRWAADRARGMTGGTLIRRATFDLRGLVPSTDRVDDGLSPIVPATSASGENPGAACAGSSAELFGATRTTKADAHGPMT